MKTNIYFVRHAEPDFLIKDDIIRPLSQKGMDDTLRVINALKYKNIEFIYSSPYKRAVDTVKNFADSIGLEVVIRDNFRERRVGTWVEDFRSFSKNQWEDFDYKLPGGENLREVQERNVAELFEVLNDNLGKNVAIGTHGTALSALINYFNHDFGHDDFWAIIDKMPYIICFTFEGSELKSMQEIEI